MVSGNKTMVLKIQRAVNKHVRIMFNLKSKNSVKMVMKHSNILNLQQMREFEIASIMHNYVHKKLLP